MRRLSPSSVCLSLCLPGCYVMIRQRVYLCYTRTPSSATAMKHEAVRSGLMTTSGCLPNLQSANDAWTSPSGRQYADGASAMTANYAVSRLYGSVTRNAWQKLECAHLYATISCVCMTSHLFLHREKRPPKGQTDPHWSVTAKTRRLLHDVEPVSLSAS